MNRAGFFVSLAAFLVSGVIFAGVSYRVLSKQGGGATGHGAETVADPEYQKMPADGQSDWMEGFTLTERSGKTVEWKDLDGQVRVASFFFSSCPANCLQQNIKVREVQQAYDGKGVVCLSITCDPEIDSPERLLEYAAKLEASPDQWLFLTGRLTYIRRVASELFGVALDKKTHTERLIVCDKWGKVRGSFWWNRLDEMAELRILVDKLLVEKEAARLVGLATTEKCLSEVISTLPHVNAALNALATILLVLGYVQIKRRKEQAHKWTMLACFGVSAIFLTCYLTYHFNIPGGSKKFPDYPPDAIRYAYYAILLTHVVLAASVPFLAVGTIWLGLADRRAAHRKLAWWTFPIWLYVSVTGVVVYLLLYQLFPPSS